MNEMSLPDLFQMLSDIATVIGIPLAILVFLHQEHKERIAEQEEIYDKLMDHYDDIIARIFEHPDIDQHEHPLDNPELRRQQKILYEMLVTLFERAFILLYGEKEIAYRRMWNSWEDYILEWLRRPNFRAALPALMVGEDKKFVSYMAEISGLPLVEAIPKKNLFSSDFWTARRLSARISGLQPGKHTAGERR